MKLLSSLDMRLLMAHGPLRVKQVDLQQNLLFDRRPHITVCILPLQKLMQTPRLQTPNNAFRPFGLQPCVVLPFEKECR